MIILVRASELKKGDTFSTDGGVVHSAAQLHDGRVSVELWLDQSGGISKRALLAPDFLCPLWMEDIQDA